MRCSRWLLVGMVLSIAPAGARAGDAPDAGEIRTRFLRMANLAAAELQKPITVFHDRKDASTATHHMPFFEDAHAVRALCVAYDVTGDEKYLAACCSWANRMLDFQARMIPAGAYYMNHGRAPGENKGAWNVADSGSIAMGVLATAVRLTDRDPARYARYLDSVRSFASLVIDNYVRPDGGITNGLWPGYSDSWWCSSATAGSLLLLLFDETAEEQYLCAGRGALEWMVRQDFRRVKPIDFTQRPSGILFYCFELYAIGLRHLEPTGESHRRAMGQLAEAVAWMREHPIHQEPVSAYDHFDVHVDMAGLPYLKYIFARQLPTYRELAGEADRDIEFIARWLFHQGDPPVSGLIAWEVLTWGALSYAERVAPGALYRSSKRAAIEPAHTIRSNRRFSTTRWSCS